MKNATLKLRGMSCASCANNIEETIRAVPGVEANWIAGKNSSGDS